MTINYFVFLHRTKIFIRHAQTLFAIEDAFQERKKQLVSKIKAIWLGKRQRKAYLRMRMQVVFVQKYIKRFLAVRQYKKRKWACNVVREYVNIFDNDRLLHYFGANVAAFLLLVLLRAL